MSFVRVNVLGVSNRIAKKLKNEEGLPWETSPGCMELQQ